MKQITLSFWLLVCLLGFPQISETIYTPSLPDIAHSLATSEGLVEMTLSIFFVGFAIGVFLWGILADFIGRRQSILLGLLVYLIGTLLCSLAPSISYLLLFRFIQAIGSSVGSVVTQTMIRDRYEGKERHQLFSALGAPLAASPAVGPFLGGLIDQFFGWNANFLFLFGMGILLFFYSYKMLPETMPAETVPASWKKIWSVARRMCWDLKILGFVCLIGAANGILFSYYAEAPFLFIDLLGFSASEYGLVGLAVASPIFLASLLSHYLNKRWRSEQIILLGVGVIFLGSFFLSFYAWTGMIALAWRGVAVAALVIPLVWIFFGIGLVIPNSLSLALTDYQEMRGTAASLLGLFYYLLIACFTAGMSYVHSGTALPMPLYFVFLSLVLGGGYLALHCGQFCQVKNS